LGIGVPIGVRPSGPARVLWDIARRIVRTLGTFFDGVFGCRSFTGRAKRGGTMIAALFRWPRG